MPDDESILFQGFEEYAEAQRRSSEEEQRVLGAIHRAVHERFDERRDRFRNWPVEMVTVEAIAREAMEWIRMLAAELGASACGLRFRPPNGRARVRGVEDPERLLPVIRATLERVVGRLERAEVTGSEFALAAAEDGRRVGVLVQPLSLPGGADHERVACGCVWYVKTGSDDAAVGFGAGQLWAAAAFARDWDSELSVLIDRVRDEEPASTGAARRPGAHALAPQLIETLAAQRKLYEESLPERLRALCADGPIESRMFGCSIRMTADMVIALTATFRDNLFAVHEGLQRLPEPEDVFLNYASQAGIWPLGREGGVRALDQDLRAYLERDDLHRHVFEHAACMVGAGLAVEGNHPSMRSGLSLTRAGRFAAREFVRLGIEHPPLIRLLSDCDDTGVVTADEPELRRNLQMANLYEAVAQATIVATVLTSGADLAEVAPLLARQQREYRDIALFLTACRRDRQPLFGRLGQRTLDVLAALDEAGRQALARR